ncbi:MAG TPA: hypothetical protein VFG68_04645 [Fimbriiglobus sp.]|nr:hypothetical protein [Fimbriiglobus sp.]
MLRFAPAVVALALAPTVAPADPLRHIPKDASLVVVVEDPRQLAEAVRGLDAYKSAQSLPAVREFLDSTTARRVFQFVRYYERELGAKWPELLDKVAGGGVALGTKIGMDPAPVLLVVQGTDEAASAEFFKLAVAALEQETARRSAGGEAPAATVRRAVRNGVETVHLGDDLHAARVGAVLYVSNKEAALNAGLDLKPGDAVADRPGPKAARQLLGGDPLAWAWLDFAKVKEGKQVKDFFAATRKDLFQTLVFGSSADAFRRADFIAAGLHRTADGFTATLKLPAKRADLHADLALHAPPPDQPGSLPLLEPKGVIYSQSFYLDLGALWAKRKTLINEQQLKDIEKGEKQISKFIPGPSLGKLLEMSGPYHRIVAVQRSDRPYPVRPDQAIPPAALVSSMRDPRFGKSAASALRAGAMLASIQTGLKMSEETHDGVTITSYRFPEEKPFPGDTANLRFNFVPCFAVVGDFLVVSSSPALVKELIPELKKSPDPAKCSPAVWRAKTYAVGIAQAIRDNPEPVVTNAILSEGVGLDEAKKQVEALADWAATLGAVGLSIDHGTDAYEIKLEWKTKRN